MTIRGIGAAMKAFCLLLAVYYYVSVSGSFTRQGVSFTTAAMYAISAEGIEDARAEGIRRFVSRHPNAENVRTVVTGGHIRDAMQ